LATPAQMADSGKKMQRLVITRAPISGTSSRMGW
jgi:hypothetical protein